MGPRQCVYPIPSQKRPIVSYFRIQDDTLYPVDYKASWNDPYVDIDLFDVYANAVKGDVAPLQDLPNKPPTYGYQWKVLAADSLPCSEGCAALFVIQAEHTDVVVLAQRRVTVSEVIEFRQQRLQQIPPGLRHLATTGSSEIQLDVPVSNWPLYQVLPRDYKFKPVLLGTVGLWVSYMKKHPETAVIEWIRSKILQEIQFNVSLVKIDNSKDKEKPNRGDYLKILNVVDKGNVRYYVTYLSRFTLALPSRECLLVVVRALDRNATKINWGYQTYQDFKAGVIGSLGKPKTRTEW